MYLPRAWLSAALALLSLIGTGTGALAATESPKAAAPRILPTYADLADLAEASPLVLRAKITKVAELDAKKVSNVRKGWARLYVEAVTTNLLTGPAAVGEALRYLADVPRDAKGKVPKLKKVDVLLFARHSEGGAGELQLVAPDAQLLWDAATEARLRTVLSEIYAPDAPRHISGVREAIFVPGNLVGEGETQIFLSTTDDEPAAITVLHQPGLPVAWAVSWSEVVESAGRAPAHDTLNWYRLACFLPPALPSGADVSATLADRAQAEADYQKVIADLGPCYRNRN